MEAAPTKPSRIQGDRAPFKRGLALATIEASALETLEGTISWGYGTHVSPSKAALSPVLLGNGVLMFGCFRLPDCQEWRKAVLVALTTICSIIINYYYLLMLRSRSRVMPYGRTHIGTAGTRGDLLLTMVIQHRLPHGLSILLNLYPWSGTWCKTLPRWRLIESQDLLGSRAVTSVGDTTTTSGPLGLVAKLPHFWLTCAIPDDVTGLTPMLARCRATCHLPTLRLHCLGSTSQTLTAKPK